MKEMGTILIHNWCFWDSKFISPPNLFFIKQALMEMPFCPLLLRYNLGFTMSTNRVLISYGPGMIGFLLT